ncbi:MAG: hypothetical protein PWP23_1104 [Candidatus Sumerlaeota bacterium]|nr:hypothetical protein [Candidatus Sumerlaeota bacterium]
MIPDVHPQNRRTQVFVLLASLALVGLIVMKLLEEKPAPPASVPAAVVEPDAAPAPSGDSQPGAVDSAPAVEASAAEAHEAASQAAAPAVIVEPVAVEKKPLLPGSVLLTVVEEGTEIPLPNVVVRLRETAAAEDAPALEFTTNEQGRASFFNVTAGEYDVVLKWGRRPEYPAAELTVADGEGLERTVEMEARTEYRAQLVDTEENPVAGHTLIVSASTFDWREAGNALPETVRTGPDGMFIIRAYPDSRPITIRSDSASVYSSNPRRGWTNPHYDMRSMEGGRWGGRRNESEDSGEPAVRRYYLRSDVVTATGVLVNPPANAGGFTATVRSRAFNYMALPVIDNEFTFKGLPGAEVGIIIARRSAEDLGFRGISRDISMDITLPEKPGPYRFEVPFPDRLLVRGVVYEPGGKPAENVRVRANGFEEEGAAAGAVADQTRGRRGGGRGGWNPGLLLAGESSLLSEPTGADGRFEFELNPASEYLFSAEPQTLDDNYKGADPVTVQWQELEDGKEVVLFLEVSHLFWGEVVTTGGEPVAGARVVLGGEDLGFSANDYATTTDGMGFFEMNTPPIEGAESLPEGSPRLYITAFQGRGLQGLLPVLPDAPDPARVVVYPTAEGTFVVTSGGQPVQRVEIVSYFSGPGFGAPVMRRDLRVYEDEDGRYRFSGVPREITWFSLGIPGAPTAEAVTVQIPLDEDAGMEIGVDLPVFAGADAASGDSGTGGRGGRGGGRL